MCRFKNQKTKTKGFLAFRSAKLVAERGSKLVVWVGVLFFACKVHPKI